MATATECAEVVQLSCPGCAPASLICVPYNRRMSFRTWTRLTPQKKFLQKTRSADSYLVAAALLLLCFFANPGITCCACAAQRNSTGSLQRVTGNVVPLPPIIRQQGLKVTDKFTEGASGRYATHLAADMGHANIMAWLLAEGCAVDVRFCVVRCLHSVYNS